MRFTALPSPLHSVLALRGVSGARQEALEGASQSLRRSLSLLILAGLVLLAGWQTLALRGDLWIADITSYFCYVVTFAVCAAVCFLFAKRERGMLQVRWFFFVAANVALALGFMTPVLQHFYFLSVPAGQFTGVLLFALARSLILLAAATFLAGTTRTMMVLDAIQAGLFCVLQLGLIFAPRAADLFTENHLAMTTALCGFLLLTAFTASLGATTPAESRFLRLLSLFLSFHLIGIFCANQVSYVWLHHKLASIWDVPETVLNLVFALIAVRIAYAPTVALRNVRPTVFVRHLMPSFLALGNLLFGLALLLRYPRAGAVTIVFAVGCYVLRTVMLQASTGQEREALRMLNQQLEVAASLDNLTGAGNRRSLAAAVGQLLQASTPGVFALVLIDIDDFKQANDLHGHLYGDEVLIAIANLLSAASVSIRGSHCARFGGDEFALLLPGLDAEESVAFADRVRDRVRSLALCAGERTIAISAGVTVSTVSAGIPFEEMVRRADVALYRAKSLGRDRVELATGELGSEDVASGTRRVPERDVVSTAKFANRA